MTKTVRSVVFDRNGLFSLDLCYACGSLQNHRRTKLWLMMYKHRSLALVETPPNRKLSLQQVAQLPRPSYNPIHLISALTFRICCFFHFRRLTLLLVTAGLLRLKPTLPFRLHRHQ